MMAPSVDSAWENTSVLEGVLGGERREIRRVVTVTAYGVRIAVRMKKETIHYHFYTTCTCIFKQFNDFNDKSI